MGERHFLKLFVSDSVSLSPSPSQSSFMERNLSGQRLWLWSIFFFFFERSIFDSLVEREREMKEAREPEREIFLKICKAMVIRLFSPKASYK